MTYYTRERAAPPSAESHPRSSARPPPDLRPTSVRLPCGRPTSVRLRPTMARPPFACVRPSSLDLGGSFTRYDAPSCYTKLLHDLCMMTYICMHVSVQPLVSLALFQVAVQTFLLLYATARVSFFVVGLLVWGRRSGWYRQGFTCQLQVCIMHATFLSSHANCCIW